MLTRVPRPQRPVGVLQPQSTGPDLLLRQQCTGPSPCLSPQRPLPPRTHLLRDHPLLAPAPLLCRRRLGPLLPPWAHCCLGGLLPRGAQR